MTPKTLYLAVTKVLTENRFLGAIIGFQHRYFPLPIAVFDLIFRRRVLARLFAFYGHHVFHADYTNRASNEDYWMGRRSLYWHLFRQHDIFDLDAYPAGILALLKRGDLVFAEPGFGIGKQTRYLCNHGALRFERYIASEPNDHVRAYAARHLPGVTFKPGGILDLLTETFDVLVINGGVLMYCDRDTIDRFFSTLPATGCRYVIVMGEGGPREVVRPDNTTMYALKDRLRAAYPEKSFVEDISPGGQYAAFAMLDSV